jgi:hypothetical protein
MEEANHWIAQRENQGKATMVSHGFTCLHGVFNAFSSSKNQFPVGSGTLMQLNFW